jgi:hypothetical protein
MTHPVALWSARERGDRGRNTRMTPAARVCTLACALSLAGCASWTPSWDFLPSSLSGTPNVSLTIESDPPGADAKTSFGPSCRTPCMIPVPADREFTVNYSLNGYVPQVVPVRPRSGPDATLDVAGGVGSDSYGVQPELAPNPVYAQLQPAAPPAPTRKGRGKPRAPKQPPPLRQ